MTLLELALMRQERRALHKEDRECRHGDVRHRIGGVLPPTPVWEALEALAEAAEKGTQALHLDVESYFVAVSEFPAAPTRRIFSKCGNSDSLLAQSAMAFSLGALTSGSPGVDQLLQMRLVRIENRCFLEGLIALFKVVAHSMWFHVLMAQDFADSALRNPRQAHMPRLRSMLAGMLG